MTLLLLTLFFTRALFMLKSYWWVGMCRRPCGAVQVAMWLGGGPCDFSVSPSPFGLNFWTLNFGLMLDNNYETLMQTF